MNCVTSSGHAPALINKLPPTAAGSTSSAGCDRNQLVASRLIQPLPALSELRLHLLSRTLAEPAARPHIKPRLPAQTRVVARQPAPRQRRAVAASYQPTRSAKATWRVQIPPGSSRARNFHGRFKFQKECSYEEWAGGRAAPGNTWPRATLLTGLAATFIDDWLRISATRIAVPFCFPVSIS